MKFSMESTAAWVKQRPFFTIFLILFSWATMNAYHAYLGNPFKVTDPSSRWFDARNFNILDYPTIEKQKFALGKIFPRGTDVSYVDFIMYNAGGQRNLYISQQGLVRYDFHQNLRYLEGWFINFEFDENGKLVNINPLGNGRIFNEKVDVSRKN